jgi:hypothetical protein
VSIVAEVFVKHCHRRLVARENHKVGTAER